MQGRGTAADNQPAHPEKSRRHFEKTRSDFVQTRSHLNFSRSDLVSPRPPPRSSTVLPPFLRPAQNHPPRARRSNKIRIFAHESQRRSHSGGGEAGFHISGKAFIDALSVALRNFANSKHTKYRTMHNIICFETEWLYNSHKGNQFNLETKLLLDCLRNFYNCDIIHRHILSRENLQYYMNYFISKRKFDKYDIVYFACHGSNHTISFEGEDDEIDLIELAAMNKNFFSGKIVHFSSCRTLTNEKMALEFKKQSEAKLVTGYRSSVDAMRAAIADMAYFNELMHIKNVGVILNDTSKFWKTYKSLLEELKFTRV